MRRVIGAATSEPSREVGTTTTVTISGFSAGANDTYQAFGGMLLSTVPACAVPVLPQDVYGSGCKSMNERQAVPSSRSYGTLHMPVQMVSNTSSAISSSRTTRGCDS